MAPDTQSIDCTATFLTLGLALSHPFGTPIDDPEYADSKTRNAAIRRVDLDDDEDEDDEEEDDEEYEDDEEDEEEDEDEDLEDEEDHDEEDDDEDDIKLI